MSDLIIEVPNSMYQSLVAASSQRCQNDLQQLPKIQSSIHSGLFLSLIKNIKLFYNDFCCLCGFSNKFNEQCLNEWLCQDMFWSKTCVYVALLTVIFN